MAREFVDYSPEVPLGVTWEEQFTFIDEDGNLVDLSGYTKAHAQLRLEKTVVCVAGVPTTTPMFELTVTGSYGILPAWPGAYDAITLGGVLGTITSKVNVDKLRLLSPTNAKVQPYWEWVLIGADDYRIPIINGRPVFLPATTIVP